MKFQVRRALSGFCAAAALVLIASCGGGDQVDPFDPDRLLAFGDESSVITAEGKKYTINALTDDGQPDCEENPNWVQYMSLSFDLPFAGCNPGGGTVRSIMYATPGAKVADFVAQVAAHRATPGERFGDSDLVTVLIGQNDILEQYQRYPGVDEATITAELVARAKAVAEQVASIAGEDGKIIIAAVPDQGVTPFARKQGDANAALLGRLSSEYNTALRLALPSDSGRNIGFVSADRIVRLAANDPEDYGYRNGSDPACLATAPLPDCTDDTLFKDPGGDEDDDASPTRWLWADDLQLSPAGHRQVGRSATSRARNNPF